MSLTAQIAVFLGATVLAIPLFRMLRLSSILGYLAAGVVIGILGRRIVPDTELVMHTAEFGVVLLLFVIGLELQPSRLRAMRKAVFGLGVAQVLVTTTVFTSIAVALGLPVNTSIVVAFALSLSSTPLVLQLLAERQQLNTHYGRSSFAVLLFQDIAVMPMLAILPLLGGVQQDMTQTLLSAAKGLGVIVLLVFGGRYLLRPVLRIVAETKVSEAFTAAALLVVLGTALLVDAVGLSMALGAFVAGLLLADSEYRHELEADIEPFKGLLLGLFFMSVGLSANLGLLIEQPGRIALLVAGLITVKFLLLYGLARATRHSPESARGLAFALPQAGEFGFVLFSLAVSNRVLDPELAEMLVIVVTISMVVSPLLMSLHTNVIEPRLAKPEQREFDRVESQDSRVIIAGFGRFGQIVGRILRARRIPFTALEASQAQVDFVRRFGNKIFYGDASRLELLRAASADKAQVLVLAIDDVEASVRTADMMQRHFPHVKVYARARNRQHAFRLMDCGVRYLIRETFLSSLDMAEKVLEGLGTAHTEAAAAVERFRAHDQRILLEQYAIKDDEEKLIAAARESARQLEQLFDADQAAVEPARRAVGAR